MRFQSKPASVLQAEENERKNAFLLPDKTQVSFEVKTAVEKQSKSSGKDMFEIDIQTFMPNGDKGPSFRDWIVPETQMFKLHQFCRAVGLDAKYDAGDISGFDMEGRHGELIVGVEVSKDPQYSDRNKVRQYIARDAVEPKTGGTTTQADLDDGIPF